MGNPPSPLSILCYHWGAARRGYAPGVSAATQTHPCFINQILLLVLFCLHSSRQQQSYVQQFDKS